MTTLCTRVLATFSHRLQFRFPGLETAAAAWAAEVVGGVCPTVCTEAPSASGDPWGEEPSSPLTQSAASICKRVWVT